MKSKAAHGIDGLCKGPLGCGQPAPERRRRRSPLYRMKLLFLTAALMLAMTGVALAALSTYFHGSAWENGWYTSSGSSTINGGWMENEDWDVGDVIRQETTTANPPFQIYAWQEGDGTYLSWSHPSQSGAKSRCKWSNDFDSGYEPLWCKKRT